MSCTYIDGKRHYCIDHKRGEGVTLTPEQHEMAANLCSMLYQYDIQKDGILGWAGKFEAKCCNCDSPGKLGSKCNCGAYRTEM